MLGAAKSFVQTEKLSNVTVLKDDLFATQLPSASFDLLHSRFEIAPLGRVEEQVAIYRRLVRPGGWILIEDPDTSSWRVNPEAPAVRRLTDLIREAFRAAGGNLDAGRELPSLLRQLGFKPKIDAHVVALPPGHPYLRLPLQFAASLRSRLEDLVGTAALEELLRKAEDEINRPGAWGTTFTLVQTFFSVPS